MNYRCIIQYDGTNYEGWQKQNRTEETVQGKFEKALLKVTGEEVAVIGAGRTDSGVHSSGQTAN
ncbi:MAG: tRNA pseudouridine(38-40) synthase TruA, partial [Dialister sp.]|nr:tRNA pseudouridine(38-40) synthase TruA [Dialister sp.]